MAAGTLALVCLLVNLCAVVCSRSVAAGAAVAHAVGGLGGGLARGSGRRAVGACVAKVGPGLTVEATVGALAASSRSQWQEMAGHHIEAATPVAVKPASVASTAWPFASGLAKD